MSALRQVRERVEAGQPIAVIAREMDLSLDLAEQMVGHWERAGVVTILRADGGGVQCADASELRCAGCFFSSGCPSRS